MGEGWWMGRGRDVGGVEGGWWRGRGRDVGGVEIETGEGWRW